MFEPKENPGYDKLTDDAARLIAGWTRNEWYESSTEGDITTEGEPPAKEATPVGEVATESELI